MANPELIEYAKNQLKAGSSANYIRTVLIKQGWGERDVDDALGIAQAEAGPAKEEPSAKAAGAEEAKPKTGKNMFLIIAAILTGVFFLISAGISLYALITIGNIISSLPMPSGVAGQMLLVWSIVIIELLAGIFWIIFGIKEIKK